MQVKFKANQAGLNRLLYGRSGPVALHVANIGRQVGGAYRDCVPVVSGDLQGGIRGRLIRKSRDWGFEIWNRMIYASWIEDGKRYDPRSGRTIYVKVGPRPCLRQALRAVGLSRSRRI